MTAVAPGAGEAAALLRRILAKPPHLAAPGDRMRLEQLLHDTARGGRLRAVIALVDALADAGFAFTTATPVQQVSWREWRLALPDGRHVVDLRVHANRLLTSASFHYHALAPAARKTRTHRLQEAFYARYRELSARTAAKPRARLTPEERRIVLVGALEADVNNGGFSQYLLNKGRREAGLALAALHSIGARRTARLLERALADRDGNSLDRLDTAFNEGREDLAALAAKHASLTPAAG